MIGRGSLSGSAKLGRGSEATLSSESAFSWASYWATRLLFESDTIDHDNSLLLDKTDYGNNIALGGYPCFQGNNAGGWYHNSAGYVAGWTFTIYGEFIYNGSNSGPIFSFARENTTASLVNLTVINGKFAFLERVSNVTYTGSTDLVSGQRYKLLFVATTANNVCLYINGSTTPEISMQDKNFAWDNTTYKFNIGCTKRSVPFYMSNGKVFNIKLAKDSVKAWTTIHTECDNWWPLTDQQGIRQHDVKGTAHLLTVGTISATNVSTQDYFGYHQQYGYTVYQKAGEAYLHIPKKSDGTRLAAVATGYTVVRDVTGSSSALNMCQCTIKVPYSAAMAIADTALGGLLFTGETPNAIDVRDIWTDQNEVHWMFANVGYDSLSDLLIFNESQTGGSLSALYRRLGYSTTPLISFNGSLVDISGSQNHGAAYSLVTEDDGFILPVKTELMTAAKIAGIHDYFWNDTFQNAIPIRFSDLPNVTGQSFFCDRSGKMRLYKKDLLPSHLATVINDMFGITGVDFYITTKDGVNYRDISGERYVLSGNVLNLNPSASADAKYDIFDRRNIVGSAKEIWAADITAASLFWTWNHTTGTYKLNQATVYKFIQAAYKDRIFWNQEYTIKNNISLTEIIVFTEALTGAAKTVMYTHIDFPETLVEPVIVGDGATDDAITINAAIAANANTLLYQVNPIVLTSIKLTDSVRLTLVDSIIKATAAIEANTIRNNDYDNGNEDIEIYGYGVSKIDGNAANQVRDEVTYFDADFYKYFNLMFVDVTGLKIKGMTFKDPAAFNLFSQLNTGVELRNIILDSDVSQINQDGIDIDYGTQYASVMFITGNSGDDTFSILNGDATHNHGYQARGTRLITNIFYRDLAAYPTGDGHVIRWHRSSGESIQNLKYFNITNDVSNKSFIIVGKWAADVGSGGIGDNFYVRNFIGGCATTNAFWLAAQAWSNIDIDKAIILTSNILLLLGASLSLTNVSIKTILNSAPTTELINDSGATLVNFTHEETINY